MATFTSRNISTSIVPVQPERIWDLVSDPTTLAELTPLIKHIKVRGQHWVWALRSIGILGHQIEPTFTELMTLDEDRSIGFRHDPPAGTRERGGANGHYELRAVEGGSTNLSIDISLCVDLPLPHLTHRAVEGVMSTSMQQTGKRFAVNLYKRLGLDPGTIEISSRHAKS